MSTKTDYSKINNIKQLVALLKERDEQLKKRDNEVKELTVRFDAIEATSDAVARIERLDRDGYRQQQYSRRECVELVGLPEEVSGGALEAKVTG